MKKRCCIYFCNIFLFINVQVYATSPNERFIDPQKYRETNVSETSIQTNSISEQQKQQEIIKFLEEKEDRNEKIRISNNSVTNTAAVLIEKEEEFEFLEAQDYRFIPINAIVLDAGHGGKDPGGRSNGIEEKRLVLTLVKKIHALFRKYNKKVKIYVTRKDDRFVSLEDRVSKTARWSARKNILFVSIHGNIAYNPSVAGFEIYTLSDKASDTDALATERIENAGFSAEDIKNTESIYSILADLIRDGTRIQSEWLARYVYDDTLKSTQLYGRGLKRANFFVLKYNTVPSILVEVGYMSNKAESKKLQDEEFQNKLAIGLFKGISRYITEYNQTEGFLK